MSYERELPEILDLVRGGGFIEEGVLDLIKDLRPELSREVIRRPRWATLNPVAKDLSREIWMIQPLSSRKRLLARTYYPPQGKGGKGLPPQGRAPTGPIGPGPPPGPPPTPQEETFGDLNVEAIDLTLNMNRYVGCKYELLRNNATMQKATLYTKAQTLGYYQEYIELGLYDDSPGNPSVLQCRSDFAALTTSYALKDFPFTTTPILNAAYYWFIHNSREDWIWSRFKDGGTTMVIYNSGNGWVDLPATWPGTSGSWSRTETCYVTYTYIP
jgi:hypothetical protein